MAGTATDIEQQLAELSDSAFDAFCEDISAMFDADVQCTRQQAGAGTVGDVRKLFKKLTAVHLVQATGTLDGTFPLFFDQGGLFVLSGVIVMLPENKILEDVKRGSVDDADNLTDACREVGNLLVGSWDRVFREDCDGHEHFLKTDTFIGKPWEDAQKVGLSPEEPVYFAVYEMSVASYPSFSCAAVFPKRVMTGASTVEETVKEAPAAAEPPATSGPPETPPSAPSQAVSAEPVAAPPKAPAAAAPVPSPPVPEAPADSEVPSPPVTRSAPATSEPETAKPEVTSSSDSEEPAPAAPSPEESRQAPVQGPAAGNGGFAGIPQDIESIVEMVSGPVSAEPAKPAPKPRPLPQGGPAERDTSLLDQVLADYSVCAGDTALTDLLNLPAKKVMSPEVIWCDPEETVQDVIGLMQQNSVGYVLVGREGQLEGLLSNTNIQGAVSPYLRPVFAKWRRPEDDATLGIKVKWIMSRPVRTVKPETPLASVIESMCRYGGRCLPVADAESKVLGLITVFDVLLRVLEADQALSWKGKPPQVVPVLI